MGSFAVEYVTEERRGAFVFNGAGPAEVQDFFGLFGTVDGSTIRLEAVQRATDALKARVADYCDARCAEVPKMGAFKKMICDLSLDEAFLIIPAKERSPIEDAVLETLVEWGNGNTTEEEIADYFQLFGPLLQEYRIESPATNRRNRIGNAQKAQRQCRFCDLTAATGATFDGDAHAISRGFGNVHLKLADECDTCNNFFGSNLEPQLLAFFDIPRVHLGTRGRGENEGRPHAPLRGGGTIFHDGERIIIEAPISGVPKPEKGFDVTLDNAIKPVPEHCYRMLAKFALSVVPEAELPYLKETAAWVRYGTRPPGFALPIVYESIVPLPPNPSAQMTLYVRLSDKSPLPHVVGEFRLGPYVYVFMVPFSAKDQEQLAYFEDARFKALFRHYFEKPIWRPLNLDSPIPLENSGVLRLTPRELPTEQTDATLEGE